ncbi:rRNA maturation RNase YbeY [Paenalcaligenes hominis]|uniref:Endoribonuclease YbeY n=1 Tax=Paenalcaligenes hominis TaxID=643674 RepID=A0ABX0WQK3_9BURK|nr:rRNA maturation RNase YbeY [Paenalcaligenes hominis]NJB64785.1 putative rRNA maturation factor [Paenalcaligenes hominis]GGE58990.1 endoribonuclease YbeY [Paenalcaligenes hominis]
MIPVELDIQFAISHPDLTSERITLWVQTAVSEATKVYTDAGLSVPYAQAQFTFRFCDADEAKALNHQYRDKDYATNVLTFEYGIDATETVSSDIIICIPVLEAEALEQKKTFLDHAAHLCIHGVLHALGYDHLDDDEAEEMEGLEIDILQHLAIANPYLG